MNVKIMFYYLFTVFVIFGIVQGQGKRNCPPLSSLECKSCGNSCNKQGFVKLRDGTFCTGCPVRLRPTRNMRCPPYRCHMLQHRPGCQLLDQYAFVGWKLCPVCSVLHCLSKLPTVSIKSFQ